MRAKTKKSCARLEQDALEEILPEAFAAVREASKRTIGLRHYDVQMVGGSCCTAPDRRDEDGRRQDAVATLPLYLNAITGRGTHL